MLMPSNSTGNNKGWENSRAEAAHASSEDVARDVCAEKNDSIDRRGRLPRGVHRRGLKHTSSMTDAGDPMSLTSSGNPTTSSAMPDKASHAVLLKKTQPT